MRKHFVVGILALCVVFNGAAFAADEDSSLVAKKAQPARRPAAARPARRTSSDPGPVHSAHAHREATLGIGMIINGGASPGFDATAAFQVHDRLRLYLGGELGMYFHFSPFVMIFPLLPTAYFKFSAGPDITPRIGFGIGPAFQTRGSAAVFMFTIKPGIDWRVNNDFTLAIDMRLGSYDGTFIFVPNFGLVFNL